MTKSKNPYTSSILLCSRHLLDKIATKHSIAYKNNMCQEILWKAPNYFLTMQHIFPNYPIIGDKDLPFDLLPQEILFGILLRYLH